MVSRANLCCRKPHVNVGTIGHVGHGKTTLTAAITKVRSGVLWFDAVPTTWPVRLIFCPPVCT